MKDFREQNYYELLEVPPYATAAEIEAAYQRAATTFSADSMAVYALFSPEELTVLRRRIDEAFSVLHDPERRRSYDRDLNLSAPSPTATAEVGERTNEAGKGPPIAAETAPPSPASPEPTPIREQPAPGLPAPEASSPPADQPRPPPASLPPLPPLGPDTVYSGALLKQIREARGLSLERLSEITKINIFYLRVIEDERFRELPALVYTRGYLRILATTLKLDPAQVTRTFLERAGKLEA